MMREICARRQHLDDDDGIRRRALFAMVTLKVDQDVGQENASTSATVLDPHAEVAFVPVEPAAVHPLEEVAKMRSATRS